MGVFQDACMAAWKDLCNRLRVASRRTENVQTRSRHCFAFPISSLIGHHTRHRGPRHTLSATTSTPSCSRGRPWDWTKPMARVAAGELGGIGSANGQGKLREVVSVRAGRVVCCGMGRIGGGRGVAEAQEQ